MMLHRTSTEQSAEGLSRRSPSNVESEPDGESEEIVIKVEVISMLVIQSLYLGQENPTFDENNEIGGMLVLCMFRPSCILCDIR